MKKITINELTHNGMRRVKIIGDVAIDAAQYVDLVPLAARDLVVYTPGCDDTLGIFQLEIMWPVYGPWEVIHLSPKNFRRFMFVGFAYSERVSNCMEIARDEFFSRTHFAPRDVYVQELPKGADIWMEIHGCILQVADWMPAQCVAVGGRDV